MTYEATVAFTTSREQTAAAADVAHHLREGGWIVYPTETVYGIGCALLSAPLHALAEAKRPGGHRPFLLLVPAGWDSPDLHWTGAARRLAEVFWPGPLTLALEASPGAFPAEVTAADGTVAIRHSPHAAVRTIVQALGAPITSTSANVPGEPPARTAAAGEAVVRRMAAPVTTWVLDGGALPVAAPSTLVRAVAGGVHVVRAGAIADADIHRVLREWHGD